MVSRLGRVQQFAVVLVAGWCSTGLAASAAQPLCDRACLEGFVDRYLDAVVANQPTMVPLAASVRFTEDGQPLRIGDGLWNTLKSKTGFRLFVTDVDAGQVAFLGTIEEDHRDPAMGTAALIALRLRVANQQISEIEQIVVRDAAAAARVVAAANPDPLYLQAVPARARMARADLVSTANKYFAGMQQNDGRGDYPFAEDCVRHENGMQTTSAPTPAGQVRPDPKTSSNYSAQWSCMEQFQSGLLHFVNRIRDRRFVAVDQERGIVFAFGFFDHSGGATRHFKAPDGRDVVSGPVQPWTWQIAELFKIESGKIRRIEAFLQRAPYGMASGWSTPQQGMSDAPRDVTMAAADSRCDRQCLTDVATGYLAALVAHDPARVPLARDVRFVENLQRMKPGEGLWATASAVPHDFRIIVPDATAQGVGFIVMMDETVDGKAHPVEVGGRLVLKDGNIVEAEHVVVHAVRETSLKNLERPHGSFLGDIPEAYRDSRSRLLTIGRSYYDALDFNNGSLAPFADTCTRRENGMQTARNAVPATTAPGQEFSVFGAMGCKAQLDAQVFQYIDSIDNIRVAFADEQQGLAIGFSHFRHSMSKQEYRTIGVPGQELRKMQFKPFDLPAVHIFKIWGGQIQDIEALGFTAPYMSATGWE